MKDDPYDFNSLSIFRSQENYSIISDQIRRLRADFCFFIQIFDLIGMGDDLFPLNGLKDHLAQRPNDCPSISEICAA
jgi:hypothetical protein